MPAFERAARWTTWNNSQMVYMHIYVFKSIHAHIHMHTHANLRIISTRMPARV